MRGFTIIELLVVVAIGVILAVTGLISLSKYRTGQNLRVVAEEVRTLVHDAQRKSIIQEQGAVWGVRFVNSATDADTIAMFKGTAYTPEGVNRIYAIQRGVSLADPLPGAVKDAAFQGLSGGLAAPFSVTLRTADQARQAVISISAVGTLTVTETDVSP